MNHQNITRMENATDIGCCNLGLVEIVQILFMSVIDLVAIICNSIVILVIIKTPHLRHLTHLFVLNLCVLDLLCSIVVIPFSITTTGLGYWTFGEGYCKANGYFNSFFAFSSILTLCVISLERYFSIAHPMSHAATMTLKKVVLLVLYIWVQSALLAMPPLLGLNAYEFNANRGHCTFVWQKSIPHIIYISLIGLVCFLLPAVIILITYCNVFRVARLAARQVVPFSNADTYGSTSQSRGNPTVAISPSDKDITSSDISGTAIGSHLPGEPKSYQHQMPAVDDKDKSGKSKLESVKAFFSVTSGDIKAAKTIILITTMFLLLWTPYFALHFVGVLKGSTKHQILWERLTTWIAYTSCAVNPILYGGLNRQVRMEIEKWWHFYRPCRKRDNNDAGADGPEDFFQFLERTSMLTRTTSVKVSNSSQEGRTSPNPIVEVSEDSQS